MTATGLVWACVGGVVGRYYDPATAQFTTPDPLNALTGSRYGYAANDPINGEDPLGLCSLNPFGSGNCYTSVAHTAEHIGLDIAAAPGHVATDVGHAAAATGEWAWNNRGTIVTGLAIGACVAQPELCVVASAGAYAVRAEQRLQDAHWSMADTWKANLVDLAVTGVTAGVGSYFDAMDWLPARGTLARRLYDGMYAFPDVASFLESRITGEDAAEALTGYGEGCQ